jgi:DNA-binding beta-propeller fold protein YncE
MRPALIALTALILLSALAVRVSGALLPRPAISAETAADHELWVIDQSDTTADGGGTLYIYDGAALGRGATASPEVIDLGGAARDLCLAATGTAPRRPHMTAFNANQSYFIIAFVVSGHVLFMDAQERRPVACIDVGEQAHAALPSPDDGYVLVANQNGKLLQRITTDYATGTFALESDATLNLATCVTPSGAPCEIRILRPDNAPICPVFAGAGSAAFVTLRGGGMFIVDGAATPIRILAEYDRGAVHPNGCGGVGTAGKVYINSGGGTPANPLYADLYAFPQQIEAGEPHPPNAPAPRLIFSHNDRGFVDSHGAVLAGGRRFLWVGDRAANQIVVVDTASDAVVGTINLAGPLSDDPAPDLMAATPDGRRVYATLRGPNPLSGNAPDVNNAVGSTPGVGVIEVRRDGREGSLVRVIPISHRVDGVERADPHGLAVRRK